jgi:glutamine amidotransferase
MKTVAVVDYGMGNLRSVSQAVHAAAAGEGYEVVITARPAEVRAADRVVLPGQGAMPDCMRELRDSGMQEPCWRRRPAKPLFGVCVGMQMLLDTARKARVTPATPGLGLIPGEVVKFELAGRRCRRMAAVSRCRKWAGTRSGAAGACPPHPVWGGVPDGSWFYFVHSFYARPSDARHSVARPTTAAALPRHCAR